MEQIETDRFSCEACAKVYRWKPELAAKRVKCKCGHVMTAPQSPVEDDLYAMAPAPEKFDSIHPPIGAIAPQPISPRQATTSPVMAYAGSVRNSQPPIEESIGGSPLKEIYVPAAMVLVGMFLQIWLVTGWHFDRLPHLLPVLGARLLINLVLSFIGIMFIAKLMEISFGAPGPMVLKLTAIALAVPGFAGLIGGIIGHDSFFVAAMISTILQNPIGIVLFVWLFEMDLGDALYCMIVIWLVNQWAMMFIMAILFNS